MLHHLTLISTGGTLEKEYIESDGEVKNFRSKVGSYLSRLRLPYLHIIHQELMNMDSLFMKEEHREKILGAVKEFQEKSDSIVVTHGTDTMTLSGEYLKARFTPKVAIVFTGAMAPLGFENSDALQNLTEALLASQILPPGFYLAFHGHVFEMGQVRKNRDKSCFEPIASPESPTPEKTK